MDITLIVTNREIGQEQLKGNAAVVFDVLRATSTIVTALANGCREIIPVVTVEDALRFLFKESIILGGERNSLIIPGFHHGNSPLEYTPEKVREKTLVLTTTNGTRAIRGAAEGACQVLIGSLLNARAVAREILRLGENTVLVCAGTRGAFSLEDTVAAGMVILELMILCENERSPGKYPPGKVPTACPNESLTLESDLAVAAYHLAIHYREEPLKILYHSLHGQKLAGMGLTDDLAWCARLNHLDIVPVYREGKITLEKP